MAAEHPLDNAVWSSLRGAHAGIAQDGGRAVRYPPDVSPFTAIDTADEASWSDLGTLVGEGNHAVLFRRDGAELGRGWTFVDGGPGVQMIAGARLAPVVTLPTRALHNGDVAQMLDLIALTQPGPFGPRTVELGGYIGAFEGDQLIGMAGRRLQPDGHCEISAVCVHPDHRRRGFAAALTAQVAEGIRADGLAPFLHVAGTNAGAQRVYAALGFSVRTVVTFQLVRWQPL